MKFLFLFLFALAMTSGVSFAASPSYGSFSCTPLFDSRDCGVCFESSSDDDGPDDDGPEKAVLSNSGDPVTAFRFNTMPKSCFIYLATEFTPDQLAPYVGCSISAVNVTAGCTYDNNNKPDDFPVSRVRVFATESLDEIPHSTVGSINRDAFSVSSIELDKPLTITGDKPVYIGYMFEYKEFSYFIPSDNVNTPAGVNNTLVALTLREKDVPQYANYSNWGMGSLCISADITGDNLPYNLAKLTSLSIDPYFDSEKICYLLDVKNIGANDITSVMVKTEISNGTVYNRTFKAHTPIEPGKTGIVEILNVPNEEQGIFNLTAVLTKVNAYNVSVPSSLTGSYASYDNGYPRFPVIEMYTSSWNKWGPKGIVMMDFLKERYPKWIRVALHVDDPMTAPSAVDMLNDVNLTGKSPFFFLNRIVEGDVLDADDDYYTPIYESLTQRPAYANIDFSAECIDDGTYVDIFSVTEFSFDTDIKHLISFAIVEDEVGPYTQTNGYAYGVSGSMSGWENMPRNVETLHDDVLRELSDYPGSFDALPDSIKMDMAYEYRIKLPLANVKSDKFRIIGMVTNAESGEIVNAREHVWYKDNGLGVNNVRNDFEVAVKAENGNIMTQGAERVEVFTTDGRRVGTSNLVPGIYIVVADGHSFRVLMK